MRAFIIKFEFTSLLCSGVRIPSLGKKNKCKLISSIQCSKNEKNSANFFLKNSSLLFEKQKMKICLILPIFEGHQPMQCDLQVYLKLNCFFSGFQTAVTVTRSGSYFEQVSGGIPTALVVRKEVLFWGDKEARDDFNARNSEVFFLGPPIELN